MVVSTTSAANDTITVTAWRHLTPTLGAVLDFVDKDVGARAVVRIGSLGESCVFPFFLEDNTQEARSTPFTLVTIRRGSSIDVGSGSNEVREEMQPGACGTEGTVNDPVDLKPGASAQYKSGWDDRFANVGSSSCPNGDVSAYRITNAAGQYELNSSITPDNCPRLIIMPVLPDGTYSGNENNVPIRGFAAFWVRDYCQLSKCNDTLLGGTQLDKGDVWGYSVPLSMVSGSYSNYNGFATKVVVTAQ